MIKTITAIIIILILGSFLMAACSVTNFGCSMLNNGLQTVKQEFQPSTLLAKYEEFKKLHAALESMQSTIATLENSMASTIEMYGQDATKWPRDVRQDVASSRIEIAGTKGRFNQLASEYNAKMSMFNYRFTNVGDLPQGATEPLPRAYVLYITK